MRLLRAVTSYLNWFSVAKQVAGLAIYERRDEGRCEPGLSIFDVLSLVRYRKNTVSRRNSLWKNM